MIIYHIVLYCIPIFTSTTYFNIFHIPCLKYPMRTFRSHRHPAGLLNLSRLQPWGLDGNVSEASVVMEVPPKSKKTCFILELYWFLQAGTRPSYTIPVTSTWEVSCSHPTPSLQQCRPSFMAEKKQFALGNFWIIQFLRANHVDPLTCG